MCIPCCVTRRGYEGAAHSTDQIDPNKRTKWMIVATMLQLGSDFGLYLASAQESGFGNNL
jgi:hypothetical protein